MASKPETAIRSRIHAWIKLKGGFSHTVHGSALSSVGEPDICGSIPDKRCMIGHIHLKLEVKTPSGAIAKAQLVKIQRYKEAGYCAGIVRSVDDVQRLVKAYRRKYNG